MGDSWKYSRRVEPPSKEWAKISHGHRTESMNSQTEYSQHRRGSTSTGQSDQSIQQYEQEITHLKQRNRDLEATIQQFQESAFKSNDEAQWQPLDDKVIEGEISDLREAIGEFAKDYVISIPLDRLSEESFDTIAHELHRRRIVRHELGRNDLKGILAHPRGSELCMAALISAEISERLLANPFSRLAYHPIMQECFGREGLAYGLDRIYARARVTDEDAAEFWRAQTIRWLAEPSASVSSDTSAANEEMQQWVQEYRSKMAEYFKKPWFAELCKRPDTAKEEDQRLQSLQQLFQDAGRLSGRLWTQRTRVVVRDIEGLPNEQFSVDSRDMKAHPCHRLADRRDRKLNGKPVKMVIHCAVLGQGMHDGTDFERNRVWGKAVVWIEE